MKNGDLLEVEIMARKQDWSFGISIYMRQQTVGEGDMIADPVTFTRRTPDKIGETVLPMLQLDMTTAQKLVDDLWLCGIRPTEGSGSAGSLAATQKHLEDMRRLVFKEKKDGE